MDASKTIKHSQKQAKYLRRRLEQRFQSYGLELNQEKTRTVYCKCPKDERQDKGNKPEEQRVEQRLPETETVGVCQRVD